MVGIYGHGKENVIILERNRTLFWRVSDNPQLPVAQVPEVPIKAEPLGSYALGRSGLHDVPVSLQKQDNGNVTAVIVGDKTFARSDAGSDPSRFYHVAPVQPVAELREKALKLSPPAEAGPFRKPELLELITLDPSIHLDIRYASARNFLSTPVYTQARAFMQRPAAVWEATPPEGKIFVADPQKGSKHNRGCAVDLTLYDLATGQAIEMPGLYDEMSPRSFPNFPGGTSLQRWHRDVLRRAMESEGFTVNEDEWWHFDYKDWKQYGILNVPFEKLAVSH